MALNAFNSLGGFSVGIPAIEVIDENGNITVANLTVSNISFSNTNIIISDSNTLTIDSLHNLRILGGTNGYVITTDGTGNLFWSINGSGGGNGSPSGTTGQIQYNVAGEFGSDPTFVYLSNTSTLQVTNLNVTNSYNGNGAGLTNLLAQNIVGTVTNAENANISNNSNLANFALSVEASNVANLGNIYTVNLNGNSETYLNGNGLWSQVNSLTPQALLDTQYLLAPSLLEEVTANSLNISNSSFGKTYVMTGSSEQSLILGEDSEELPINTQVKVIQVNSSDVSITSEGNINIVIQNGYRSFMNGPGSLVIITKISPNSYHIFGNLSPAVNPIPSMDFSNANNSQYVPLLGMLLTGVTQPTNSLDFSNEENSQYIPVISN